MARRAVVAVKMDEGVGPFPASFLVASDQRRHVVRLGGNHYLVQWWAGSALWCIVNMGHSSSTATAVPSGWE